MKIDIISFGDVNKNWTIAEQDDAIYLTREKLFNRIRLPKIITDVEHTVISDIKQQFSFPAPCNVLNNAKTFNSYIRVMKDAEKEERIPENIALLSFSKKYKFIEIDDNESLIGNINSVFIDDENSAGCLISYPVGVNGKLFSGVVVFEDSNKLYKVTVGVSKGATIYTETPITKNIEMYDKYKFEDSDKYIKKLIRVTHKKVCTAAFIIKGSDYNEVVENLNPLIKTYCENDIVYHHVDDNCTDDELLEIMEDLKVLKYHAVTFSDNIALSKKVLHSKSMRYIFKTDKFGNVQNVKSH